MSAPNIASGTEPASITSGSRNELTCAANVRETRGPFTNGSSI